MRERQGLPAPGQAEDRNGLSHPKGCPKAHTWPENACWTEGRPLQRLLNPGLRQVTGCDASDGDQTFDHTAAGQLMQRTGSTKLCLTAGPKAENAGVTLAACAPGSKAQHWRFMKAPPHPSPVKAGRSPWRCCHQSCCTPLALSTSGASRSERGGGDCFRVFYIGARRKYYWPESPRTMGGKRVPAD